MSRQREIPKISMVFTQYNGNTKAFDLFMRNMICEYLSGQNDKKQPPDFVGKVEKPCNS